MSALLGELGGVAANTAGETIAFAAGSAGRETLSPIAEAISQKAWETAPIRLPAAEYLALGVAQGQVDPAEAKAWARKHGYGDEVWTALVSIANTGPALSLAYQAWRRRELTDQQFRTALHRTGLEPEWFGALEALRDELLDAGAIATAIHRGIMAGGGLLLREPPQTPGRVPFVPQSPLSGVDEFAGHGITAERGRILVGNTGLPLALGEMLRLWNMGVVDEADVQRAIAQSNTRNEYMDVAVALRRRLLTPTMYEEAALRGIISQDEADAGAALSGVEPADARLIFETMGRPITVRAITTGLARGAKLGGTYDAIPEPYRDAIRRSSTRPEYAALAYANRYTYPSAFVLRSLAQAGELSETDVRDVLLKIGWEPTFAEQIARVWAAGNAGAVDPNVKKAQTQLWTAIHKAYVNDEATDTVASAKLAAAGVAAEARGPVLTLWREERELVRALLTPAQVKKGYASARFTRAEALAYLTDHQGMSAGDAAVLLDE